MGKPCPPAGTAPTPAVRWRAIAVACASLWLLTHLHLVACQTATSGGSSGGGGASLNYTDALVKSILFFDAQRSGRISGAGARMPTSVAWRNNSGLGDGAAQMPVASVAPSTCVELPPHTRRLIHFTAPDPLRTGPLFTPDFPSPPPLLALFFPLPSPQVDLEGGYYEGGSNVKYGLPAAFATTMLAWSLIDFRRHIEAAGGAAQLTAARNALRWSTDYLVKAHTGVNELWAQVGDPVAESACWQRPEDMSTARTAYRVNADYPGSDLAAETAAALAAASLALRPVDGSYASTLLGHAEQVTHGCCCIAPTRIALHHHKPPLIPPSLHFRSQFQNARLVPPPSLIPLPSSSPSPSLAPSPSPPHLPRPVPLPHPLPFPSPPRAQLFVFADTYRGSYSDAVPQARRFSTSNEGSSYQDELAWAAVWLHRATGYGVYVDYLAANDAWIGGSEQLQLEMSWQHKLPGAQVLIAQVAPTPTRPSLQSHRFPAPLPRFPVVFPPRCRLPAALSASVATMAVLEGYRGMADLFVCAHMPANPLRAVYTTPGGLLHVRASNAQFALATAFLLALHSDSLAGSAQVVQCEGVTFAPPAILAFAQSQVTLAPRPIVSPISHAHRPMHMSICAVRTLSHSRPCPAATGCWSSMVVNLPHLPPPTTRSLLLLAWCKHKCLSTRVNLCASAAAQVDYLLGSNPLGLSFMLGFGSSFPLRVHHRAASIVSFNVNSTQVTCEGGVSDWLNRDAANPNVLVGAIVGGPDAVELPGIVARAMSRVSETRLFLRATCLLLSPGNLALNVTFAVPPAFCLPTTLPCVHGWQSDAFQDSRVLPAFTEPSACANAPAVGLLARLAAGALPPAPHPPPFPPAPPSPPPRPPASPPPLCSASFFCPSPPPVAPTPPSDATVDPAVLVTVACEVTGGWEQYGEQQSRWSCVVANTGSAFPVRHFRLRCHDFEPSQAWNMDALSCQLPWWATQLAPNESISFGFVQSAAVVPAFTVDSLVSLAPPPPPSPPPSPPTPPNPPPGPPPRPPPSPPPKPPPNSPPRPPPRPPPNPPPSPPPRGGMGESAIGVQQLCIGRLQARHVRQAKLLSPTWQGMDGVMRGEGAGLGEGHAVGQDREAERVAH
ncbi:unnamed protein product [Closterium sp. NIES-53]